MAIWTANANNDMNDVQNQTGASAVQMATLRTQIDNWANVNPNGHGVFPFGRFNNHAVGARTDNAAVVAVNYGDRP